MYFSVISVERPPDTKYQWNKDQISLSQDSISYYKLNSILIGLVIGLHDELLYIGDTQRELCTCTSFKFKA